MYSISYDGEIIHKEVNEDECRMILFQLAEKAADGVINTELIEIEEVI